MLDEKNLLALAKATAKAAANPNAPVAYSFGDKNLDYQAMNDTLREELNGLAGNMRMFRRNKNLIYDIIEETIDEVLPARVKPRYEDFAETRVVAQGDRVKFRRKMDLHSRTRAKQFVTRVGLAGVYEVFKLGKTEESFEVPTNAIGTAVEIGFEEFLDGRADMAELLNIVLEGMDDLIFEEIGKALDQGVKQLPALNRVTVTGFDPQSFDQLVEIARAYGGEPTVYCTEEFAVKMIPQEAWRYTEAMKDELFRTGRVKGYKNLNIVILPNGYRDIIGDTASGVSPKKIIDPSKCYIIGSGADTRPVKIVLEGDTQTSERDNRDWSKEIQIYKKVGVLCMFSGATCIYTDTTLTADGYFNLTDTVKNVYVEGD